MNPLIQNKVLILPVGASGSGKSTFSKFIETLHPDCEICSADLFWGDGYDFDPSKLGQAHAWCKDQVELNMLKRTACIIVDNTNTTGKERKPYIELAEKHGYVVVSYVVQNLHGSENVHGVPAEVVAKQKEKILNNIKL
jgi:predicted kinase